MPKTETRQRKWRMLNRERYLEQERARYQRNREQRKAESLARYHRQKEIWRVATKRWRARNKERIAEYARKNSVRHHYGLSFEQYEQMERAQRNLCAICGNPSQGRRLDVDHDHQTKKVRELLCSRCNRMIGAIEKSKPGILALVEKYLAKHESIAATGDGNRRT